MRKKHERKDLEQILRRRGSQQTPVVKPNVTEIRSCGVSGDPEPLPPDPEGLLGGLVIIWEFAVEFDIVDKFHQFLRDEENHLIVGLPALDPKARYVGTYMLHAGGTPRYRTLWAYESLKAMTDFWQKEAKANGNMAKLASRLRAYWLRDPQRSEARWIPAQKALDEKDHGDAFLKLTVKAQSLAV
jgi:hypothetical protein